ncbi:hypothetical protein H257_12873 [Aphanomyces astaci]|uniref:Uncharacterized protein n=1 Tax=Aphanomyces astaci TaxID=112090 RepID=W4FZ99_APHAT|nr:hypothetical protein H257_12873 [Aphanomyces astaci]ETV72089.1 hypothetical protein H257_12873 [Aphanomyces astaci]|eukprot:XP_009838532.1 hypothetical protein H257_12873 [Aphanomyces astaci]
MPQTVDPSATKGCLRSDDINHRVARCPKAAPGETVTSASQALEGRYHGAGQPDAGSENGARYAVGNIVCVDDVPLDTSSDVTIITRGVVDGTLSVKFNYEDAFGVVEPYKRLDYLASYKSDPALTTLMLRLKCTQFVRPYEGTAHKACRLKIYDESGSETPNNLEAEIAIGDVGFDVQRLDERDNIPVVCYMVANKEEPAVAALIMTLDFP